MQRKFLYYTAGIMTLMLVGILFKSVWRSEPGYSVFLKEKAPYHAQYAETTKLMEKKQWQPALKATKELKEKMLQDASLWESKKAHPGNTLYAFNLLRIALLEKECGNIKEEIAAWKEFRKNAGWGQEMGAELKTHDPLTYQLLEQSLRIGESSLADYVQKRITSLER